MNYLKNHKEITIGSTTYSVKGLVSESKVCEVYSLTGPRGGRYRLYIRSRSYGLYSWANKPVKEGLLSSLLQDEKNEVEVSKQEIFRQRVESYLKVNNYELAGANVARWETEVGEKFKADQVPKELAWKLAAVTMTQSYKNMKVRA